jgi:hypothetical protein
MTDKAKLDRLYELLQAEFVRCTFPNGREAYMREFEGKFEASLDNLKIGGEIDRSPNPWWKNGNVDAS